MIQKHITHPSDYRLSDWKEEWIKNIRFQMFLLWCGGNISDKDILTIEVEVITRLYV